MRTDIHVMQRILFCSCSDAYNPSILMFVQPAAGVVTIREK